MLALKALTTVFEVHKNLIS